MRPVPRARHPLAFVILLAVALAVGAVALHDAHISDRQVQLATAALKRAQPDLYPHDPIFGASELYRFHTPIFQAMLEVVLVPGGYDRLLLPFRLMAPLAALVYLLGMYALLYRQCRSWSVSVFVAVLSLPVIYTPGRAFWGVGAVGSIVPAGLFVALTPLLVLGFLRNLRQWWQLVGVFFVIGLLGNLHLVSAMNLTLILLLTYVAHRRFRPHALAAALACGAGALLGALPYTGYFLALRAAQLSGADLSAGPVLRALEVGSVVAFYPMLFEGLIEWLPYAGALGVAVLGVLARVQRFRVRNGRVWVWFLIAAAVVAFGFSGLSQLIGWALGAPPPVMDFLHASKFIMLPLYVLFATSLTALFRLVRHHRKALRAVCGVLLALWVLPSDSFRYVRHELYSLSSAFLPPEERPLRVHELAERRASRTELHRLGVWMRENTPTDAVVIFDEPALRMWSRRSMLGGEEDAAFVYHLAPARLSTWLDRIERQKTLLHPPGGQIEPEAVETFAAELADRAEFAGAEVWYVVLRPEVLGEQTPPGWTEYSGAGWGEQWRLFEIE